MRVITIASDAGHPFLRKLLIPSCRTVGLRLTVLLSAKNDFRPGDKRAVLADYLAGNSAPDDLVVFTDAYDTVFIRGEDVIRERFAGFSRDLVFGAESNSYPLGAVGLVLRDSPPVRPYPYLNSGGFIGTAGAILDLCARYPAPPSDRFEILRRLRAHGYDTDRRFRSSDQYYWTLVQLLEPQTVGLDHEAQVFEYLGPALPDVRDTAVQREWFDFGVKGRASDGYHRERERLVERLRQPSAAAQLHFASPITKAVALDLFDEQALPPWLRALVTPDHQDHPDIELVRV